MKASSLPILLLVTSFFAGAQKTKTDSLLSLLTTAKGTALVDVYYELSSSYFNLDPDSMFLYAQSGLQLAQATGYRQKEIDLQQRLSVYWWSVGDYATAIKLQLPVLVYAREKKDTTRLALILSSLLRSYRDQGDYKEALQYGFAAKKVYERSKDCGWCGIANADIGSVYYEMNKPDSALLYLKQAEAYTSDSFHDGWVLLMTGRTYSKLDSSDLAYDYYHRSFVKLREGNNLKDLAGAYTSIAAVFQKMGQMDSAIFYGKYAQQIAQQKRFSKEALHSYLFLATAHEKTDPQSAIYYHKLAMAVRDSLYSQEKQRQILSFKFNEELRQQEAITQNARNRNQLRLNAVLGITFTLLVVALLLWRNNRHRQKSYALLEQQKTETDQQRNIAEQRLEELKATQAQLVQHEKMASLGELTAGIAHEIQNPLNFVNNFSAVNKELVSELKQEAQSGNIEEVLSLAGTIEQNEEKISHHGRRADAIVKGMLQHSKSVTGEREPTDLNAFVEQYLQLAYHGYRAKDKNFNTDLSTHYDPAVGRVHLVPQEIGRVLLNLFNNAFYAVGEKTKLLNGTYEPTVQVSTKKEGNHLTIAIKDNGTGMSKNVAEKVFQPFFTTKPPGEGTGLGLSLGYDIITKGHGGNLSVNSKEGEGAEFVVELPAQ